MDFGRLTALRDLAIGFGCRAGAMAFRRPGRSGPPVSVPSRMIVIKTGSVGDVLMATAAVRALRASVGPQVHVNFAVGSWSKPLVAGNNDIDRVVDLGSLGGRGAALGDYLKAIRHLRAGRYDCALVLDRAPLITFLPYLAGIPWRVGLDSDGRGFSLSKGVPCPEHRHEADLYQDVVRGCGFPISSAGLAFFPSCTDHAEAQALLNSFPSGEGRPLMAVHPGGGVNPGMSLLAKRWPVARFAGIADRLAEDLRAKVLIVGGRDDVALAANVASLMCSRAIDLAGRLTWGQLGALLQRCQLLLANDTGAAHLAVAVGTRAVVVFGPTDPRQYGPYAGRGEAVSLGLDCQPCFRRGRFPRCHYRHCCLSELKEEAVWPAVMRQWQAQAEDSAVSVSDRAGSVNVG